MRQGIFVLLVVAMIPVAAQEKPKTGPSDKASLSFVSVGGNSQGQSLGFANEFKYQWAQASLQFNVGGVRVRNTQITRTAIGTETDFVVTEQKESRTTAENYYGNLRYDHKVTDRLNWFAGAGWQRNRPSGLEARYNGLGGLGYFCIKNERTVLRTDLGLGYQKDTFLIDVPGVKDSYATGNLVVHYEQKAGTHSQFTSDLAVITNFADSRAWTGTWRNAFTSSLSDNLALKVGYDIIYSNRPAYAKVDLYAAAGDPAPSGTVPFLLKKVDTIFTTSLVITF